MDITFLLITLATLISFTVAISYLVAYKLKKSLSILSLGLFFLLYFVDLLVGLFDIARSNYGIIEDHHNTFISALINLVLISFVLYTTWRKEK